MQREEKFIFILNTMLIIYNIIIIIISDEINMTKCNKKLIGNDRRVYTN